MVISADQLPGFGIEPTVNPRSDEGDTDAPTTVAEGLPPLVHGDVATKALAAAWSGKRLMVVCSPPGGGKTSLLAIVAAHLRVQADLRVAIACQRNSQALDLCNRMAQLAPACPVQLFTRRGARRPGQLDQAASHANRQPVDDPAKLKAGEEPVDSGRHVVVGTTARMAWLDLDGFACDVLLVDEAWQLTYADWLALAPLAQQCVLVGDPGQIDPVVTVDTSRWDRMVRAPHRPAPEALQAGGDVAVTRLTLPASRRNGPASVAALQPLYPFAFDSARPDRRIVHDGVQQPELAASAVQASYGTVSEPLADAVADRARTLATSGVYVDEDGGERPLTPSGVMVVCAHVAQANAVAARLRDLPGLVCDTADAIQGAEALATVVWHPAAGKATVSEFDIDLGRLSVSLSRHIAHCSVIEDTGVRSRLAAADVDADTAEVLAQVHQHVPVGLPGGS